MKLDDRRFRKESVQAADYDSGLRSQVGWPVSLLSEKFAVFDPLGDASLEAEPHAVAAVALR